ncbi:MAG: (2Fe-2S)-binding protein [Lawsonibacter sp.]
MKKFDLNDRNADIGEFVAKPDDNLIICRCEEITKGEIRRAVHDGMRTLTEVRRFLRAGMGLCQGQTCSKLIRAVVAEELQVPPVSLEPTTARSPARPIEMSTLCNDKGMEK